MQRHTKVPTLALQNPYYYLTMTKRLTTTFVSLKFFKQVLSFPSSLKVVNRIPGSLMLAWCALITISAWFSVGWLQPDEHARVLEPAHMIAYGYASLPWELKETPAIVSWLLGVLVSPILMITRVLGLSGMQEAFLVRTITGIIASTRFIAMLRIFKYLNLNASRYGLYLLLSALAVFGPHMLVRTSQENYATTALVWAFSLHFDVIAGAGKNFKETFLFVLLITVATTFRLQVGPTAAGLGFYTFFKTGPRILPSAFLGLGVGLLPLALVDYIYAGAPFSPAWHYLQYALSNEDGGHVWGTKPWWFYVEEYFSAWFPPLSPFLLMPLVIGFSKRRSLTCVILPFLVIHFVLGHKETRYFSPMIPFMFLATFVGWEWMENAWPRLVATLSSYKRFWIFAMRAVIFMGVVAGFMELNTSPAMYQKLGEFLRAGTFREFTYVANSRTDPSQFYVKYPEWQKPELNEWDDVLDGGKRPQGWVAIYGVGPVGYDQFLEQCELHYLSVSKLQMKILDLLPRHTPIRRRLNSIMYCAKPLYLHR